MAQEEVGMRGWLEKTGRLHKAWRKRWFVLEGSELAYYKSAPERESRAAPQGSINIANAVVLFPVSQRDPTQFEVVTPVRRFELRGENLSDVLRWVKVIKLQSVVSRENAIIDSLEAEIQGMERRRSERHRQQDGWQLEEQQGQPARLTLPPSA